MFGFGDIARWGLARRSDVQRLEARVAALEEGGGVDLKNLELTDATWVLNGKSRIIFKPGLDYGTTGIYFDEQAMLHLYRSPDGRDMMADVAMGLSHVTFAEKSGTVEVAYDAERAFFGENAQSVYFGADAQRAEFGTGWGENLYCGICTGGGACMKYLDITDADWVLRGDSCIKFSVAMFQNAGIFANNLCMLVFTGNEAAPGGAPNVWVADRANWVEIGTASCTLCVGFDGFHNEFGTGGGENFFGMDGYSNHYYGI